MAVQEERSSKGWALAWSGRAEKRCDPHLESHSNQKHLGTGGHESNRSNIKVLIRPNKNVLLSLII